MPSYLNYLELEDDHNYTVNMELVSSTVGVSYETIILQGMAPGNLSLDDQIIVSVRENSNNLTEGYEAVYHDNQYKNNSGQVTTEPSGIPGYRARIRPIVSRITIHWPSFYNVVTGKTLALPNLIALQHIPLSPAGVIAKRPAPIALPNSCAAEWRMAPDAVFSPYASVRYFTPHMVHSQYNLL